ncbi:MAG: hypothetical protein ACXWAT_00870 [Methylobacter sp.]
MSFTDAERTDIRRFCGYPMYGGQPVQAFGYRFSTHYGTLEFKLNNMQASEEAVVRTTYLANLATLETAIVGASANLDTAKAAVWEHNKNEVRDRERLFDDWRRRLCQFLGVPPGPGMGDSGIRLVV